MAQQFLVLAGATLVARPSGALWWPSERLLCVADLHLAKSERIARRGGVLLPPYETRETLDRLAKEIVALEPSTVLCLGDSFDDMASVEALGTSERSALAEMTAGRRWIWIAGNHDPRPTSLGGAHIRELRVGALVFRHEACPGAAPGEVSGHFHPKHRVVLGGTTLSRPCFLCDGERLILPAFGAYTGGMPTTDPVFRGLFGPATRAVLTGEPCVALPVNGGRLERAR